MNLGKGLRGEGIIYYGGAERVADEGESFHVVKKNVYFSVNLFGFNNIAKLDNMRNA